MWFLVLCQPAGALGIKLPYNVARVDKNRSRTGWCGQRIRTNPPVQKRVPVTRVSGGEVSMKIQNTKSRRKLLAAMLVGFAATLGLPAHAGYIKSGGWNRVQRGSGQIAL